MIKPTVIDILRTVETAITTTVKPEMTTIDGKSTIATIEHLLRHISLRITDEGQILTDDINRLRPLCADILAWVETHVSAADCVDEMTKALNKQYREPGVYANLLSLSEEAGELRRALISGLEQLQEMRSAYGSEDAYQQLRQRIKDYSAYQIKDEGKLIDPAYLGKGPRR